MLIDVYIIIIQVFSRRPHRLTDVDRIITRIRILFFGRFLILVFNKCNHQGGEITSGGDWRTGMRIESTKRIVLNEEKNDFIADSRSIIT